MANIVRPVPKIFYLLIEGKYRKEKIKLSTTGSVRRDRGEYLLVQVGMTAEICLGDEGASEEFHMSGRGTVAAM